MIRRRFLAATAAAVLAGCAAMDGKQDKVVYHINEGTAQASNGLRNIGNHLEVNPDAKIVVVTHALGVDFHEGRQGQERREVRGPGGALKQRGVQFDVCEITLRNRKLTKDQFIEYVTWVPSGVAEVSRLQQREGYAYLKP